MDIKTTIDLLRNIENDISDTRDCFRKQISRKHYRTLDSTIVDINLQIRSIIYKLKSINTMIELKKVIDDEKED